MDQIGLVLPAGIVPAFWFFEFSVVPLADVVVAVDHGTDIFGLPYAFPDVAEVLVSRHFANGALITV